MRFVTRAACAVLLTLSVYVSMGCGDKTTEPAKDNPSPTWKQLWSKRFGDASSQFARAVDDPELRFSRAGPRTLWSRNNDVMTSYGIMMQLRCMNPRGN